MSHLVRGSAALALALALGCGGSRRSGLGPTNPDEDGDCEPGRCLTDISHVIEDHRDAARACYDAGHARDPTMPGRLVINFEIDPTGAVVDASPSAQDDQIADPVVDDCITDVIKQITFARSAHHKSTRAFHRFEFTPH